MRKIIVALDGYSACGKSTTAKRVAQNLQYAYIDTGAMYRAVTLFFLNNQTNINNPEEIDNALERLRITFQYNPFTTYNEVYLNEICVEEEIRKMYISEKVSQVSALSKVRQAMVNQQREMGNNRGIVMDGRDIGTVVFPDAELKIFMTADIMVRAKRRQMELLEKDEFVELEEILENLKTRDRIDTTRGDSPLRQAEDAICLDTTPMTIDKQVDFVLALAQNKIKTLCKDPSNISASTT